MHCALSENETILTLPLKVRKVQVEGHHGGKVKRGGGKVDGGELYTEL